MRQRTCTTLNSEKRDGHPRDANVDKCCFRIKYSAQRALTCAQTARSCSSFRRQVPNAEAPRFGYFPSYSCRSCCSFYCLSGANSVAPTRCTLTPTHSLSKHDIRKSGFWPAGLYSLQFQRTRRQICRSLVPLSKGLQFDTRETSC